mmetsp:Transcript_47724/g.34981  ORF Transcript_47724/g.34981 Transcript_47724/m.34981 type:complete len:151 (+) Transcript_47724:1004-1456(+)
MRERLKMQKFIEMKEAQEREVKRAKLEEAKIVEIAKEKAEAKGVKMQEEGADDELYNKKSHKPMPISENVKQQIQEIDSDLKSKRNKKDEQKRVDLKEFETDEQKRLLLEKSKQLYKQLPKSKNDVFAYELNWNNIYKHDVIEKVARPWL